MDAVHAVYENGVFRPLDPVTIPEGTKVVVEGEDVVAERVRAARRRARETLAVLRHRRAGKLPLPTSPPPASRCCSNGAGV
jgi:predicted DNA-binding antitoxin AbrB/MazE fold protein